MSTQTELADRGGATSVSISLRAIGAERASAQDELDDTKPDVGRGGHTNCDRESWENREVATRGN
jgi:hypothetical protein